MLLAMLAQLLMLVSHPYVTVCALALSGPWTAKTLKTQATASRDSGDPPEQC